MRHISAKVAFAHTELFNEKQTSAIGTGTNGVEAEPMTGAIKAVSLDSKQALAMQARALLRNVAKSAAAQGRRDMVEELEASARRLDDDTLAVVVCGETNRGKSSLINALLDQPGLLPASSEASTTRHVAVQRSVGDNGPGAVAHLAEGDTREVPLSALGDWVIGNGDELAAGTLRHVEVRIDHPLLRNNLVLIDTPGVGGLERGHGEAALAALSLADAVLFVVDAGAPMSAVELDFLSRAAERVDSVIIALNRIDGAPGWRDIRDEDQQLIARAFDSGFEPPITAVSARMKSRADRLAATNGAPDGVVRDMRGDSGIMDLRRQLEAWADGHANALRAANLCHAGSAMVQRLAALERAVLESSEDSVGGLAQRAHERRQQHKELGPLAKRKRVDVQDRLGLLGRELEVRIAEAMTDVRREYQERITAKQFKAFEDDLEASLMRAAESTLAWLDERLAAVHQELHEAFAPHDMSPVAEAPRTPGQGPAVRAADAPLGKVSMEELLSRAPFVFAALAIGNPFYAIATFAGLVMHRHLLGGKARQEQHRQRLTDTSTAFAGDLKLLLHEAVMNARSSSVTSLDEAVAQRMADLGEEIRALESLASRNASERASRRQAAQEHLAELDELAERLESLRRASTGALRAAFAAAPEVGDG